MTDTQTPDVGPSPTPASMNLPQVPSADAPAQQHHHPAGPVQTNGQPLPAPLQSQTERAVVRYQTIHEGVKPHIAQVGDRTFTFNRRPNARMQIRLMSMLALFNDGMPATAETIGKVNDLVDDLEAALAAMISEAEVDQVASLFDQLDLEPLAELAGHAMEQLTARPTTGSSASSGSPQPTTSTTGSSAPGSPSTISAG